MNQNYLIRKQVQDTLEQKESNFKLLYDENLSLKEKISTVAKEIYGANGVNYVGGIAGYVFMSNSNYTDFSDVKIELPEKPNPPPNIFPRISSKSTSKPEKSNPPNPAPPAPHSRR